MPTLLEAPSLVPEVRPARRSRTRIDEGAARRSLRHQLARLEGELGALLAGEDALPCPTVPARPPGRPRLLSLGELERARDDLAERLREARRAAAGAAEAQAHARRRLEAMLLDPAGHRFVRISRLELGERGCGGWEVRPRLGLVGMLAGWWEVVVSSGCPLAMAYHHRREHSWGRNARLELIMTAVVIVVVLGVLALFLFVYHDVPLRTS